MQKKKIPAAHKLNTFQNDKPPTLTQKNTKQNHKNKTANKKNAKTKNTKQKISPWELYKQLYTATNGECYNSNKILKREVSNSNKVQFLAGVSCKVPEQTKAPNDDTMVHTTSANTITSNDDTSVNSDGNIKSGGSDDMNHNNHHHHRHHTTHRDTFMVIPKAPFAPFIFAESSVTDNNNNPMPSGVCVIKPKHQTNNNHNNVSKHSQCDNTTQMQNHKNQTG